MKKKRQKRNLISLKKGSPFEDLALIQELSDTISYVYLLKDDIFNLSKALMLYNLNDLCIELQNRYEMLIDLVEANTGDIWNYPIAPTDARTTLEAFQTNSLPTDFTRLDTKYRFPPEPINKRSWKLHHYE